MEYNHEPTVNRDQLVVLLRHFIMGNVEQVSARSGISERRIRSHMDHTGSCPNAVDMARYMKALGPRFTNAYLALIDQTGARECRASFISLHSHLALSADTLMQTTRALEDGWVDHCERLKLKPIYRDMARHYEVAAMALEHGTVKELNA